LNDQDRAVKQLDALSKQMERLREIYETRIAAISDLKQSILRKAFSGELTSPPPLAVKEAAE
jgi:type I restriction enzyme S subunit